MSSITKTTMTSTAAKGVPGASGAAGAGRHYSFQPLNIGRILIWGAFALALIVAPLVFTSSLALTMLSQIGYLIIICLSYNILLGQGGMLSFGHAVYTGLGSFIAIHAMNRASSGDWGIPLVLIPIIGGLGGMFFAALLGYVTTKKSGTTFAMITMGIGELVASMALMFPEFFGGEGGITTDRVYGKPFFGLTFGSGMEVYYLIAAYCFICTAAMFAFTGTPLGRMLNAVRDNPERVEFVGYNTQRVRYFSFIIAGFFAGVGGGLAAINFEIITAMDSVSVMRSGSYLLFTFLGGATFFFGPIIGAVLLVLASVLLSELTKAWLLYLGLVFLLMVMYAPGGVASLIMMNLRVARFGKWRRLAQPYLAIAASALVMIVGGAAIVEMIYHLQLNAALGPQVSFMGVQLDTSSASTWTVAVAIFVVGLGLLEVTRRWCLRRWERIQEEIEEAIKRGEG
ncbi:MULTISPECIES: branched-chain amino acid ABC transporter permease [Delftia]|uniref:Branched-chain amino acid ABC transporter permease n=2 Tax=Delftia TaxID=80865 RepID=A0A7T2S6E8_DELAC|nr:MULTISPECIES: branched-chain amino acid ABC transporter permease [Delftia]MBB1651548.1 ABC transporter permease [Delftia sp. UME58]MBL8353571.1 branched-chain amino acid ABC transporter permease [Delftia acidovorans]QPS09744.1 branched-chain amino acid ABC transporter permease [Delftia acidovorans]